MNLKSVLWTNITIFSIVLIIHLLRAVLDWQLVLFNWNVPVWASWLAVIILGGLVYINYKHLE